MNSARYFVFPSNAEWLVAIDGALIGRHRTRPEALRSAIVMADLMGSMQHDADVMIEDDGALAIAWRYGADPLPQQLTGTAR
jgi:hypothetical protein